MTGGDRRFLNYRRSGIFGQLHVVGADGLGPHTNDDEFREIAREIEQQHPGWIVIWGVYTQQFVAFPLFDVPPGTILTARYPDALTDRMRRTELRFRRPPEKGES